MKSRNFDAAVIIRGLGVDLVNIINMVLMTLEIYAFVVIYFGNDSIWLMPGKKMGLDMAALSSIWTPKWSPKYDRSWKNRGS